MPEKRILSVASIGVMLIICAVLIAQRPLTIVLSQSMHPAIHAGDLLLVTPLEGEIRQGMIVTYRKGENLITHRVAANLGSRLLTKGDANERLDPYEVPLESVVGSPALIVPYLGFALAFLRTRLGWYLFVILPAALFISREVLIIISKLRDREGSIVQVDLVGR